MNKNANKKLTKIRQILALVTLVVVTQTVIGLPIASATTGQSCDYSTGGGNYSCSGTASFPVIPFLTAYFRLPDPSDQKTSPTLRIVQGSFLAAYGSSGGLKASGSSEKVAAKVKELVVSITAYSSTYDQTDDTPFVTACGTLVRDGIVATNFLPFGTKIKIPELFGDKIFIVEDRMNSRYWHKIDIWFPDRGSAIEFGIKTAKIQIIES